MEKKEEEMVGEKPKSKKKSKKNIDIEEALLENFVNLQRVLTNLTMKFDNLSNNISRLLELFEISAESFAGKGEGKQPEVDKEFLKKLDSLLDQNKTISKGIMLMEEKIRNKATHPPENHDPRYRMIKSKPLPKF
jgi:hypothetical protein